MDTFAPRRLKHSKSVGTSCYFKEDDEQRACLHQKCKGNKVCKKADIERSSMRCTRESCCFSSSCSSCNFRRNRSCSSVRCTLKPSPICTGVYHQHVECITREKDEDKSRHERKFVSTKSKTKSKAMKMLNDLKKMKQPISPGGRLTTFLNSLFTTRNNKKPNTSTATTGDHTHTEDIRRRLEATCIDRKSNSVNTCYTSTCSSASSFSRSCISNTTSSRGRFSNEIKRSVRFYPVNVIIDEETDSYSKKVTESLINKSVRLNLSDENNRVSEAARNLLRDYRKKVECELDSVTNVEDENECNDGKSDSSSDLFELNSLSPIRICNHDEELPLYATTRLQTKLAIV